MKPVLKITQRSLKLTKRVHVCLVYDPILFQEDRQELVKVIHQYREGYVPLIVPITLINHYAGEYKTPYLSKQAYLQPHPIALQLRNHV